MLNFLKMDRWSAYLVGICIGILLTLQFVIGHEIGVSSAIAKALAGIENIFAPKHVEKTIYFKQLLAPFSDYLWGILFAVGLLLGAWFSSHLSRFKKGLSLSENKPLPSKKPLRKKQAFLGGILLLIGARIADGCTSGHAITGGAQLSVTSWIFMMALFATAIPVSFVLYKSKDS